MNHTPGPWHAASYNNKGGDNDVCDGKNRLIAEVTNWGETEANELLIAAAPELLKALEMMVDVFGFYDNCEEDSNALQKAKAVIAKAKGEKE